MLAVLAFALAAGAPLQEPVKVSATLTSTRVRVGETAVLQIHIETQGATPESIELPDLPPALAIASTQDFSQLQISYPGGRSRVIRRDLVLQASAAGQYLIGAVDVTIDGRQYRTRPLTLLVLPARPGEQPAAGPTDEVELRAWLEPDTAYVGEQVLLHAEALFPQDLRLRQSRPASYDVPTPTNFWAHDLPESLSTGLRAIDGEVYETQTFRRAYFALAPGAYTLPPARLLYEIRRGFLYAPETRELTSDSVRITVLPLPAEGRPASFGGAVGRYEMEASLEPATVAVGDAATLTVEVRGEGNVKALPPPVLPALPNVEVFAPTEDSRSETIDRIVRGVKRFTWVLIPEHAGTVRLPDLEYAYFDPQQRAYVVLAAQPLSLGVTPAGGPSGGGGIVLRDIVDAPSSDRFGWTRTSFFAVLQVVPLLALLGALAMRRRTGRRQPSRRQRRAARRSRLGELMGAAGVEADRTLFGDVADFLRASAAESLDRPELRTCPLQQFRRLLEEGGVSAGTRADFSELLVRLDHARFAPVAPSAKERRAFIDEAEAIVNAIEREARPVRARTSVAAASTALLAVLCAAGSAHAGQSDRASAPAPPQARATGQPGLAVGSTGTDRNDFAVGVEAYRDGRFHDAAVAFARRVEAHPDDADAWYNLGNADYAAGDRGRAVWSWLKAIRVRPRHAAARHNLAAAGADDTLRWVPPPFTLTLNEALLALCVIWWLAAGALILGVLRRQSRWYVVSAAAIVPALIVTAAALPASLRGPAAITIEQTTPLLAGPAHRAEEIRQLPQAVPLAVLESRAGWLRVRTSDEDQGWIESVRVGRI
jgi:BatD DUF11 like domain